MFIAKTQIDKPYERKMDDISCIIKDSSIRGGLWLGNINAANDKELLEDKNIGAILSVCPVVLDNRNIQHLVIPAQDVDDYDLSEHFYKAIEFIDIQRKVCNSKKGVLVHCQAGISRSVTIILAYLVQHLIIGVKEALDIVEQKRWQVYPNNGFLKQLVTFERNFFKQLEQENIQKRQSIQRLQNPKFCQSFVQPSPEKSSYFKSYTLSDHKNIPLNRSINYEQSFYQEKTLTNLKDSIVLGRYIRQ